MTGFWVVWYTRALRVRGAFKSTRVVVAVVRAAMPYEQAARELGRRKRFLGFPISAEPA